MKRILSKFYNFCSSWTGTVIIVLFIIFFIAQAFVIPSGSMKNTLLVGDYLFVKKFSYGIPTPHIPFVEIPVWPDSDGDGHLIADEGPKRGDIVVFRYPKDPKIHYVKRNFATSNDEIIFAPSAKSSLWVVDSGSLCATEPISQAIVDFSLLATYV